MSIDKGYFRKWSDFRKKTRSYITMVSRLFFDSMWRFKKTVFFVISADFTGIFLQVIAIGQAIYYAKYLEAGTSLTFIGFQFEPRSSIALLFCCAAGFIFTMLISAWFAYFSRSRALSLSRRYEEFCIQRVMHMLTYPCASLKLKESINANDLDIQKLVSNDARLCSRSFLRFMILVIPLATFVVSSGVLLLTNFLLSLILIIPATFFLFLFIKANRLAASSFQGYEQSASGTALEKRSIIQRLNGLTASKDQVDRWLNIYFNRGQTRNNLDCYEQILRTTELSNLLNGIMLSVGVFIIIIVLGWQAITGQNSWSTLLIYLVAFRYTGNSLRQLSLNIIALNRFYPQVKRLLIFLDSNKQTIKGAMKFTTPIAITASQPVIDDSLNRIELKQSMCLGLIAPLPLNRYNLNWMMSRLFSNGCFMDTSAIWFATASYNCPPNISIRECLGLDPSISAECILRDLRNTDYFKEWYPVLSDIIDRAVTLEQWQNIHPVLKFLLAVAAGENSDALIVLFDERDLRNVPRRMRKNSLSNLLIESLSLSFMTISTILEVIMRTFLH